MRLEYDGWRVFFDSYQREAFRLEILPSYGVGSEQAEYERFLATGKLDIPDDDPWLIRVRYFHQTGRWIGRVHVISRPLTDYLAPAPSPVGQSVERVASDTWLRRPDGSTLRVLGANQIARLVATCRRW